jgi:arsenite methyltransferase
MDSRTTETMKIVAEPAQAKSQSATRNLQPATYDPDSPPPATHSPSCPPHSAIPKCRIYEQIGIRELGEGLIRPGGLALTQRAVALSLLRPGSMVLDIGCGTGVTLKYLTDHCGLRGLGIDPSRVLLREGRSRHNDLTLMRAVGEHLPVADAVMDGVLAECSLSVMQDVESALKECSRVLKREGRLLVHDVYARNPAGVAAVRTLPMECCLTGAVSREAWATRLGSCGFEIVLWEDHSVALKEFAARLVFSYGSMQEFWCHSRPGSLNVTAEEAHRAIVDARPGYFLLIARKTGA